MTVPDAVLVTGAAAGIGRAASEHLARRGFRVFAGCRAAADAEALRAAGLPDALALDVTREADVEAAARHIAGALSPGQRLHLVNNAGLVVAGPLEALPLAELRRQFEVNLFGLVAVTQALLPAIRAQRGRIVNVGSILGRVGYPGLGAYSASKFAVEAVSDVLRLELAPFGVDVVLIEPGAVKTPIWEKSKTVGQGLKDAVPPPLQELYGKRYVALERAVVTGDQRGFPAIRVARVIEAALTRRRPRTRYVMGYDARAGVLAKWLLPDRVVDFFVARL